MAREQARKKVLAQAEAVINEQALENLFKAAGASEVDKEAQRSLRALAQDALAEYTLSAVEVAQERNIKSLDAQCVACGAARAVRRAF